MKEAIEVWEEDFENEDDWRNLKVVDFNKLKKSLRDTINVFSNYK